jgi:hypothetical protein
MLLHWVMAIITWMLPCIMPYSFLPWALTIRSNSPRRSEPPREFGECGAKRAKRTRPKMFNIFVFTSKGSVLVKCERENTVAWLLETVTSRMQLRQLSSPFEKAYREDGSFLQPEELLEGFAQDHPVSCKKS